MKILLFAIAVMVVIYCTVYCAFKLFSRNIKASPVINNAMFENQKRYHESLNKVLNGCSQPITDNTTAPPKSYKMERPNKKDCTTCNQIEYQSQLNKYYDDLEKYCDYIESIVPLTVDCHDEDCNGKAVIFDGLLNYECPIRKHMSVESSQGIE